MTKSGEDRGTTRPELFVLDVDGVMTTGQFLYSEHGKAYKVFGPHDSDGLKMVRDRLRVLFLTADERGYGISEKRIVEDLRFELKLVKEEDRVGFFERELGFETTVYMGDGYRDAVLLQRCLCGIAPSNARPEAKTAADYVTPSRGGEGAVLDACIYIVERYFGDE